MQGFARILLSLAAATFFAAPACGQSGDDPSATPEYAAPKQWIPARDRRGNYVTLNTRLNRDETSWHVRIALNVAALGCRDAAEAGTVAAYNRLLRRQRRPLAAANARIKRAYRTRHGARWKAAHDRQMTRVYNFFAQPIAHTAFCSVARDVLARADAVTPRRFGRFARQALPRLEAPFTAYYRKYEAYRAPVPSGGTGRNAVGDDSR
jgi:hypothetical protein